jgi:hypothetical protein
VAIKRLLLKYAYSSGLTYGYFTIGYVMKQPTGDISVTIRKVISLNDTLGNAQMWN